MSTAVRRAPTMSFPFPTCARVTTGSWAWCRTPPGHRSAISWCGRASDGLCGIWVGAGRLRRAGFWAGPPRSTRRTLWRGVTSRLRWREPAGVFTMQPAMGGTRLRGDRVRQLFASILRRFIRRPDCGLWRAPSVCAAGAPSPSRCSGGFIDGDGRHCPSTFRVVFIEGGRGREWRCREHRDDFSWV